MPIPNPHPLIENFTVEDSIREAEKILAEWAKLRMGCRMLYGDRATDAKDYSSYCRSFHDGWIRLQLSRFAGRDHTWFTAFSTVTKEDLCKTTPSARQKAHRIASGPVSVGDPVQTLAKLLRRSVRRYNKVVKNPESYKIGFPAPMTRAKNVKITVIRH